MEGLRSLDVAHREGAVGPVEQRVPEILPDRVFPHLVEERDGREHEVAFLFAGQLDLDPLHVDAKGPFVFRVEVELPRSEEHTSELQSRSDLVCRLLLEKKKRSPITDLQ